MIQTILNSAIRELVVKLKTAITNVEAKITSLDKKSKETTLLIMQLRKDLDTANDELKRMNSRLNAILPIGLQNLNQSQWDEYVDDDMCKREHKKHHHKC